MIKKNYQEMLYELATMEEPGTPMTVDDLKRLFGEENLLKCDGIGQGIRNHSEHTATVCEWQWSRGKWVGPADCNEPPQDGDFEGQIVITERRSDS